MGFCFLIRREVIDRFGLFDEVFSPGYGEENDFCLRINEHGYTSVLANRALVLHTGSTSFSGDRGPSLRLEHERILLERYPFYAGAVALFLARYRDAVDVFADAFLPDDDVVRVALHLPTEITPEVVARVRDTLACAADDVVVTVIVSKAQIRSARQAFPGALIAVGGRPRQIFDVAVALGALTTFAQLSALNANAPRWILVDPVSHDIRWSHAVANHRASAIDRILRRFENQSTSWRGGDGPRRVDPDGGRHRDRSRFAPRALARRLGHRRGDGPARPPGDRVAPPAHGPELRGPEPTHRRADPRDHRARRLRRRPC